jgi:hypothetical protein
MMDKELISMCATPEIQDRWEPKNGDVYVFRHPDYWGSPRNIIPGDNREKFISMCLYIPRIEDIASWLEDNGEIYSLTQSCMNIKWFLSLYMELIHNKKWNKGEWHEDL